MKFYTIVTKIAGPHEHGGSTDEWVVKPLDERGAIQLPPLFADEAKARAFIKTRSNRHILEVAPMETDSK